MAVCTGTEKKLKWLEAISKKIRISAGFYKSLALLIALAAGIITIEARGLDSSLDLIGGIISLFILLYIL